MKIYRQIQMIFQIFEENDNVIYIYTLIYNNIFKDDFFINEMKNYYINNTNGSLF